MQEKVEELIPLLERLRKNIAVTTDGRDQAEERRRSELSRCVRRSLILTTLVNGPPSALEEIEKRSQVLLEKGTGGRFLDKGGDSKEVAKLVERLREAITHYQVSERCLVPSSSAHTRGQVSQQQAIYDQIVNLTVRTPPPFSLSLALIDGPSLKSSFDILLKIHEVTGFGGLVVLFADT